jgi:RimJ/RimL family protein N-acetyltransferase
LTTLYELPRTHITRAARLYQNAYFDQPCYESVFEGRQEGRIFVDDPDTPTSALMCRAYEYFHAGVVHPALRQFTLDAPQEAGVFADFYGYAPLNTTWKEALLSDLPLEIIRRCNFQWKVGTPVYGWRAKLPSNGRIVPVDRVLAERLDRECYPVPFIRFDWGSYEAYEQHGFGFALFIGEAIASTITTVTVSKRHALINVATEPPFRQRGFATLISARFIEHCLEHSLLPVWDTDDFNINSIATARKLGFEEAQPFVELALPNRAKPEQSQGVWSSETRADGVIVWRRDD